MSFSTGDRVRIIPLRKKGCVAACLKAGHYKVLVGALQITCLEKDLLPEEPSQSSPNKRAEDQIAIHPVPGCKAVKRVDLHGMTAVEALDLTSKELNRAILSGLERLEIMHGIGTGKLQSALHKYLSELTVIKRYKLDDCNPGVTIVYF